MLKTSSVAGGKFYPRECKPIVERDLGRVRLRPEKDTIIFSRMNTPDLVGECGYVDQEYPDIFLPDRLWMSRHDRHTPQCVRWLAYLLSSAAFGRAIKETATGTSGSMKNIAKPALLALRIPVPPVEEQEAIANALSDTDALIESLEQLLTKKRQIKQGAMQELLTGKRRLPGFEGRWIEKQFCELFHISGGLSASRDQLGMDGVLYLHYGDIHTSDKTFVDVATDSHKIPRLAVSISKVSLSAMLDDGDVVFVDASEDDEGTSKHVVVVNPEGLPFISGLHTIVAKQRAQNLVPVFLRFCFQTRHVKEQFRFYAVGTKVSGVSKTNIGKIRLWVPEVEEQVAIGDLLCQMEYELEALESKLTKARHLKQAMMQELLTGRIRLV